jgi:undecaprenyl diphosphate synthase
MGHQIGAERMHGVVEALIQRGVKYLTVWGFSTDNWKRSPEEIRDIFHLLQLWIEKDTPWLHENGVKLKHIGRFHQLPTGLQTAISQAVELTKNNNGMTLILAFNYSGRAEIADAVTRILSEFASAEVMPDWEIELPHYLYTDGTPDVDLVIRTAGEFRLSNFMLWQTAYAEFYYSEALWPDFNRAELDKALKAYASRQRRFGGG